MLAQNSPPLPPHFLNARNETENNFNRYGWIFVKFWEEVDYRPDTNCLNLGMVQLRPGVTVMVRVSAPAACRRRHVA